MCLCTLSCRFCRGCGGMRVLPHPMMEQEWQETMPPVPCNAGSPGTMDLGSAACCELVARLRRVRAAPCFSLMAALPRAVPRRSGPSGPAETLLSTGGGGGGGGAQGRAFDAASVAGSRELAWVACDSSKPGSRFRFRVSVRVQIKVQGLVLN